MLVWQNLITAFEQLLANKARSILTVLGIIIAVTSTMVVVAVVQGFSGYITTFLEGLGTNAIWVVPYRPPSFYSTVGRIEMVSEDLDEVEQSCTAVVRMAPFVIRQVKLKYRNLELTTEMIGTTPAFQDIRNFYVDQGRCFGPVEIENRRQVCCLGQELLEKLQADEGIVGQYITIEQKRFLVIGLLEKKGSFLGDSLDDVLLMPISTAVKMYPESKKFQSFMAQAESAEMVPEAKLQIINALRRQHDLGPSQPNDFRIMTQDEILEQFNKITVVAASVLIGIVGISLLVGGIGVMNVMLVSVTERTREIGLRKAVGARRRDILAQFLTEAVVLSLLGGLTGILLGYAITYLASLHPSMVDVAVPIWSVLLGVGFSAAVGIVFGLLPAFKAAILQPIDALRYE